MLTKAFLIWIIESIMNMCSFQTQQNSGSQTFVAGTNWTNWALRPKGALSPHTLPPLPTSEGCAILPKYQEGTRNQMPWGQNKMLHEMDQAVAASIYFCLDFALQQKHNLQQSPLHLSHHHLFKMWFLFLDVGCLLTHKQYTMKLLFSNICNVNPAEKRCT